MVVYKNWFWFQFKKQRNTNKIFFTKYQCLEWTVCRGVVWNVIYVAVVILHASLRLRNVKNKINKIVGKVEYIGICRTPMGLMLEALGMEQEAAS